MISPCCCINEPVIFSHCVHLKWGHRFHALWEVCSDRVDRGCVGQCIFWSITHYKVLFLIFFCSPGRNLLSKIAMWGTTRSYQRKLGTVCNAFCVKLLYNVATMLVRKMCRMKCKSQLYFILEQRQSIICLFASEDPFFFSSSFLERGWGCGER